jgi:hypothetical protein
MKYICACILLSFLLFGCDEHTSVIEPTAADIASTPPSLAKTTGDIGSHYVSGTIAALKLPTTTYNLYCSFDAKKDVRGIVTGRIQIDDRDNSVTESGIIYQLEITGTTAKIGWHSTTRTNPPECTYGYLVVANGSPGLASRVIWAGSPTNAFGTMRIDQLILWMQTRYYRTTDVMFAPKRGSIQVR